MFYNHLPPNFCEQSKCWAVLQIINVSEGDLGQYECALQLSNITLAESDIPFYDFGKNFMRIFNISIFDIITHLASPYFNLPHLSSTIPHQMNRGVRIRDNWVLSTGLIMWIGHRKEIRISLRRPIHIINPVDKTQLSLINSTPSYHLNAPNVTSHISPFALLYLHLTLHLTSPYTWLTLPHPDPIYLSPHLTLAPSTILATTWRRKKTPPSRIGYLSLQWLIDKYVWYL